MSQRHELEQELARLRALPTPAEPSVVEVLREMLRPEITVEPVVPAPVIDVHVPEQPPAEVRVDVTAPDQSVAIAALTAKLDQLIATVKALETSVTVNVPENPVTVVEREGVRVVEVKRDRNGRITGATVTDG